MSDDFLSFEKVMRELQLEEDELKKLVSAGEIRAFRDADQMKFKKEDIVGFQKIQDGSEPDVIDLLEDDQEPVEEGDQGLESAGDDLTEEIVFDDAEIDDADESLEDISLDLEEEEEGDVGMKTEPIADEDLFADEALADEAVAEEAVADEEIAEVDDDILIGSDENEGIEEDFSDEPSRRTPVKKSRAAASAEEEVTEGPAFLGVMVVSSLVLLIGVLVMVDIASSNPSPMVEWLVGMFK